MKHLIPFVAILVFATTWSGCAGKMPQTAEEFRQVVPGAMFGKIDTFEVNRPFKEVAATFQQMAPKCLNMRIESRSYGNKSAQYVVSRYTATVVVATGKAELHLQERHEKGVIAVYKEPENGHYMMVVDAIPIDAKRTKIVTYHFSVGKEALRTAVAGWAKGTDSGCPDLTK